MVDFYPDDEIDSGIDDVTIKQSKWTNPLDIALLYYDYPETLLHEINDSPSPSHRYIMLNAIARAQYFDTSSDRQMIKNRLMDIASEFYNSDQRSIEDFAYKSLYGLSLQSLFYDNGVIAEGKAIKEAKKWWDGRSKVNEYYDAINRVRWHWYSSPQELSKAIVKYKIPRNFIPTKFVDNPFVIGALIINGDKYVLRYTNYLRTMGLVDLFIANIQNINANHLEWLVCLNHTDDDELKQVIIEQILRIMLSDPTDHNYNWRVECNQEDQTSLGNFYGDTFVPYGITIPQLATHINLLINLRYGESELVHNGKTSGIEIYCNESFLAVITNPNVPYRNSDSPIYTYDTIDTMPFVGSLETVLGWDG